MVSWLHSRALSLPSLEIRSMVWLTQDSSVVDYGLAKDLQLSGKMQTLLQGQDELTQLFPRLY